MNPFYHFFTHRVSTLYTKNKNKRHFFQRRLWVGGVSCYIIHGKKLHGWFVIYMFARKDIWLSVGRLHDMGVFFFTSFFFFFYVSSLLLLHSSFTFFTTGFYCLIISCFCVVSSCVLCFTQGWQTYGGIQTWTRYFDGCGITLCVISSSPFFCFVFLLFSSLCVCWMVVLFSFFFFVFYFVYALVYFGRCRFYWV